MDESRLDTKESSDRTRFKSIETASFDEEAQLQLHIWQQFKKHLRSYASTSQQSSDRLIVPTETENINVS
jgi:hypothetical protein